MQYIVYIHYTVYTEVRSVSCLWALCMSISCLHMLAACMHGFNQSGNHVCKYFHVRQSSALAQHNKSAHITTHCFLILSCCSPVSLQNLLLKKPYTSPS